ncbi:DUF1772 domain-containing protein [Microlunatus spumicola]|uniref:DUF1772 domain-containing protein n=1 Tax=Microlunatus spumicola TaxID=81499 RepID=A0ABP6XGT1_9ACTN
MTTGAGTLLAALAALGAALVAGVLLAFSAFVMRALDALAPADAVRAMQEINRLAPGPGLLVPLMGTALLCVALTVLAVLSLATGPSARGWLVLVGCVLYLVAFAITAGYHVPANDALALVDPAAGGTREVWRAYARPWVLLNHVRTAAAALGAAALLASLVDR